MDRHWRKSKRGEERLRERREIEAQALRVNIPANVGETQR